ALKLMNSISRDLRVGPLPEQFDFNIIGHSFDSIDTLDSLLGCVLLPKAGYESRERAPPAFHCYGDVAGRADFRIPFEFREHIVANAIITSRLRTSCHSWSFCTLRVKVSSRTDRAQTE